MEKIVRTMAKSVGNQIYALKKQKDSSIVFVNKLFGEDAGLKLFLKC
jgi:hypothetical protein